MILPILQFSKCFKSVKSISCIFIFIPFASLKKFLLKKYSRNFLETSHHSFYFENTSLQNLQNRIPISRHSRKNVIKKEPQLTGWKKLGENYSSHSWESIGKLAFIPFGNEKNLVLLDFFWLRVYWIKLNYPKCNLYLELNVPFV